MSRFESVPPSAAPTTAPAAAPATAPAAVTAVGSVVRKHPLQGGCQVLLHRRDVQVCKFDKLMGGAKIRCKRLHCSQPWAKPGSCVCVLAD